MCGCWKGGTEFVAGRLHIRSAFECLVTWRNLIVTVARTAEASGADVCECLLNVCAPVECAHFGLPGWSNELRGWRPERSGTAACTCRCQSGLQTHTYTHRHNTTFVVCAGGRGTGREKVKLYLCAFLIHTRLVARQTFV